MLIIIWNREKRGELDYCNQALSRKNHLELPDVLVENVTT